MHKTDYLNIAHKNLRDTIKHRVLNIKGGKIYETDDYILYTIGVDTDDPHLNGCLSFNDYLAEEIFNESQRFFKDLGFKYSFWIRDGIDVNLENLLLEKGYQPKRRPGSSIMVIDKKIEPQSLPQGYTLKLASGNEDLRAFSIVIEEAFEKDKEVVKTMFSSLDNIDSENVKSFIIYDNNKKPVSVAITSITKDASGIYFVGTLESQRSKGLGKAIVEESTNIGFDMGKDLVILQSSKLGEIVYNKLGYKKVGTNRVYGIE